MKTALRFGLAAFTLLLMVGLATAADRPNIVWIVSEDNSTHYMKLFDEHGVATPTIERLAEHGVTFDHAFSNAPVCSVARTTLATGCYCPRICTQFHRKNTLATLPEGWRMYPYYLREAGYYTTNCSKTDYNAVAGEGVWDESSKKASWRNRPTSDTPFYHMESHPASHESTLHFTQQTFETKKTNTDPDTVFVAPYHPDTKLFRYTNAYYRDRMLAIDDIVADTVKKLEEDGVLEDTFVFYFGDHGGVLPGSKGYIRESGLHVPLVVRVPEHFKHLVQYKPGERAEGFVNFIDFGPTTLNLAGVEVPGHMDGRPFLGPGVEKSEIEARDEAFGYADRFDEKYDFVRSLRKGKYKYLRNYWAYLPDGLRNNYRYKQLAYQEWRKLFLEGKLNDTQAAFFRAKPVEELYDIEADPHGVNNLAADPKYADVLVDMRSRLQDRVKSMPDLSFYPEDYLVANAVDQPIAFGQEHKDEIARLVDIADLSLLPFDEAAPKLRAALASGDCWDRYWALTACSCLGDAAKPLVDAAKPLLNDVEPMVRVRAAEFLGIVGAVDPRPTLIDVVNTAKSDSTVLLTLNTVVYFNDRMPNPLPIDAQKLQPKANGGEVGRRLEYLQAK